MVLLVLVVGYLVIEKFVCFYVVEMVVGVMWMV